MNLPRSHGDRFLRATISTRFDEYELVRPSKQTGPMGGTEDETTVTVELYPFSPAEIRNETDYGDRLTGALGALAHPSADINVNDRLTYNGVAYEVAETMTFDGGTDVYQLIDLTRRENP